MLFCRDDGKNLEGEGDADEGTMELGKQSVVKSFTSSESVALLCECHPWNDCEVNLGIIGEEGTLGFLNAK